MVIILAFAVLHARDVFVQALVEPLPRLHPRLPSARRCNVMWTAGSNSWGSSRPWTILSCAPQVGGTLTQIGFKDGDIVHKGDLLFGIDRVPYEIKLAQANAQLESATARLMLANRELARIQLLQARQVETAENLDQRAGRPAGCPGRGR